jgi:hypothetical protein
MLRHSKSHREARARNKERNDRAYVFRYTLAFENTHVANSAARYLAQERSATVRSIDHDWLSAETIVIVDRESDLNLDDSGALFKITKKERVRKP